MKTNTTLSAIFFSVFFMFMGMATAQDARPIQLMDSNQAFMYTTNDLQVKCMIERTVIPAGTQFVWDFGDGNIGITQSSFVYHEYETSGIYPVSVTFVKSGTSKLVRQYIQVLEKGEFDTGGLDSSTAIALTRE